jgi:hypothetical protein
MLQRLGTVGEESSESHLQLDPASKPSACELLGIGRVILVLVQCVRGTPQSERIKQ